MAPCQSTLRHSNNNKGNRRQCQLATEVSNTITYVKPVDPIPTRTRTRKRKVGNDVVKAHITDDGSLERTVVDSQKLCKQHDRSEGKKNLPDEEQTSSSTGTVQKLISDDQNYNNTATNQNRKPKATTYKTYEPKYSYEEKMVKFCNSYCAKLLHVDNTEKVKLVKNRTPKHKVKPKKKLKKGISEMIENPNGMNTDSSPSGTNSQYYNYMYKNMYTPIESEEKTSKRRKTNDSSNLGSHHYPPFQTKAIMSESVRNDSSDSESKKIVALHDYVRKTSAKIKHESKTTHTKYDSSIRKQSDCEIELAEYCNVINKKKRYSEDNLEQLHPFFNERRALKKAKSVHYCAEIMVEIENKHGEKVPIRALLDTGTSATILLKEFVAKGRAKSYKNPKKTQWRTLGGTFTTNRRALVDFKFPELSTTKSVSWICHVDHKTDPKTAQYDLIIGMDLMTDIGIYINTADKTVVWEGASIPLKNRGVLQDSKVVQAVYNIIQAPPLLKEAERRQTKILDADYSKVDIDEHVHQLDYLSTEEQKQLAETLKCHHDLFSGGLGTLKIKPVSIDLKPDAKPHHAKAFQIPQSLEATTKKEIARLQQIGVLRTNPHAKWAAPTFVVPKKTGDVRIVTDFRILNSRTQRKQFPMPKASDMLQKLQGFTYATAIDLSMGYYHIPIDLESQELCTTVLPWGKYSYCRLPMGLTSSPDIFQNVMQQVVGDLEYTRAYLADILIVTNGSFHDHLDKLNTVLSRLNDGGFRANVRKCNFATGDLEYLGYQLTRTGIKPQPKKVEAIQRISPPTNKKQLRHFLGMVNYYRDMWRHRSHLLAPLSSMVSKTVPFKWTQEHQNSFDEMKRVISRETMLSFPDFNKEFHIYTDASSQQLGAVIMQEGKPLAFYSRKMNGAQRRYTVGEQELLSIVETLKEFRNILLGQRLIVHTDHMNIIYGNLSNDRIVRWRLLLEEYGPEYRHIKGKENVVADALSRMETVNSTENDVGHMTAYVLSNTKKRQNKKAKTLVNNKDIEEEKFPLLPTLIAKEQQNDKQIQKAIKDKPEEYSTKHVEDIEITTYKDKIFLPSALRHKAIAWYHEYLLHPGKTVPINPQARHVTEYKRYDDRRLHPWSISHRHDKMFV